MIPEYRSPRHPDRFYGNQAEVKSPVMVRAQHDNVGQRGTGHPGDAVSAGKACFIRNPEAWRHDVSLGEGKAV